MLRSALGPLLTIALWFSSIASPALPSETASNPSEAHNVYFVRAYAEPTVFAATLKLERAAVRLKQGTFTSLRLPPGKHKVKLTWPLLSAQAKSETDIAIEPGRTYYFAVVGAAGVDRVEGNITYLRTGSGLVLIPPDQGAALIQSCCTFAALGPAR